ncbi:MAG: phosphatidylglycerophosphatase A [candidate division Zixibacteria bacterium]|nr:phosphatidylglycerophosphatase A [candidate division Zixibacteria bacterium]
MIALLATGLGSGMLRPFPGSWGSIPPVFLAWGLSRLDNPWVFATSTVAMIAASIWISGQAETLFGHDARQIVIDEWAGIFVSSLGLPAHWQIMILVFVLFRIFDVVKPFPARRLEGLPGGWGVTADDVAAAVYANVAARLIIMLAPVWLGT